MEPFGKIQSIVFRTEGNRQKNSTVGEVISGEAGGLIYFENQGISSVPAFAPALSNPFSLVPNPVYFSHPTMGDLDRDGDLDMLIGETGGNLRYIQNLANANAPLFDGGQLNPFGITGGVAPVILPKFVDIDNDGDLDILASGYEGSLWFYENLEFDLGLNQNEQTLQIGPNPFDAHIEIISDLKLKEIRLLDLSGKQVYFESAPSKTIQLPNLSGGIYTLIAVDSNDTIYQKKLVKR